MRRLHSEVKDALGPVQSEEASAVFGEEHTRTHGAEQRRSLWFTGSVARNSLRS